jgi:hypothetical protein
LKSIQDGLLARATAFRTEHTRRIDSRDEFYAYFTSEREEEGKPTPIHGGFALTHFGGGVELERRSRTTCPSPCAASRSRRASPARARSRVSRARSA